MKNQNDNRLGHIQSDLLECGLTIPDILLPRDQSGFAKWAVIACDQYTSQPEYWESVRDIVSNNPSTFNLIVPEAYLNDNFEGRTANINAAALDYIRSGVFQDPIHSLILVERSMSDGSKRTGIVAALDLEAYEYRPGSTSLIRATEATVAERLPPRCAVKASSPLDLSHVLVLVNDEGCTLIEPIAGLASQNRLDVLYDFDLMKGGGHLKGYKVSEEAVSCFSTALKKLRDGSLQEQGSGTWAGAAADGAGAGAADGVGTGDADGVGTGAAADGTGAGAGAANGVGTGGAGAGAANGDNGVISSNGDISSKGGIRGIGANVMLFATGDGNHSLAAAKMYWNSVKANLSEDEAAKHPARFAMAEIVNIHSEAMIFEPIHRVVFNTSFDTILEFADKFFKDRGVSYHESHSVNEYTPICESHSVNECRSTNNGCRFDFPILSKNRTGVITVEHPASGLPTAELQAFLDDFCMSPQNASAKLDYIHGEKELFRLCEEKYCVCFLLPPIDKRSIFQTVIHDGVLPRKAFSLGQPNEKRYYMESRLIRS